MAATSTRSASHRPDCAPPPTPIATGKGLRSAAADNEVLAEYLEASLKVPDLTLPHAYFPSRSSSPTNKKIAEKIDLPAVAAGDADSVRRIAAAAAQAGGFRIDGGEVVTSEEVRAAVEAGTVIFDSVAARRRGLVSRFAGGTGEEICWYRSRRKEMEPVLEDVPADTYRSFREKMEVMAAKLEMVADCISNILCEHVQDETHRHRPPRMQSVLCLRKRQQRRVDETACDHRRDGDGRARCLSIHLPTDDHHIFRISSSAVSDSFSLPAGSILVTVGEQMQEWCNGAFMASVAEMLPKPRVFPINALFSMEFIMYSLPESCHESSRSRRRTIFLTDQLLVWLLVAIFFKLWACKY